VKLIFLGTGGAISTPRLFCNCSVCSKARKMGEPYRRNNSSIFIKEIETLIDCGEDISDSLNRRNIYNVNNVFITHWHPDHTFGLRSICEANYDFRKQIARKVINIYIPLVVYRDLKKNYPIIEYYVKKQKTAKLILIKEGREIKINRIGIVPIRHNNQDNTFSYLLKYNSKNILYSPCDTKNFINMSRIKEYLNILITENGVFEEHKTEITLPELIKRLEYLLPKRTIITHIEEIDLNLKGNDYLDKLKKRYKYLNIDFAFDGMEINV